MGRAAYMLVRSPSVLYILSVLNNKRIAESPVILFLGAGASAALGKPMMAEFVDKVSKNIEDKAEKELLGRLRKFRGDDLEMILGELDTIIDLDYASSVNGFVDHGTGFAAFSLERSVANRLRRKIKHEIIREYRSVDSAKAVEIYKPLFDRVFMSAHNPPCQYL
jgi:hypothetical protein